MMDTELTLEFEEARMNYLEITALLEVLEDERRQWYDAHGITRQTIRDWVQGLAEMPSDLAQINRAASEAILLRNDARSALIEAACKITAVIAARHGRAPAELDRLWEHLRRNPYSIASQKALDAILRLHL